MNYSDIDDVYNLKVKFKQTCDQYNMLISEDVELISVTINSVVRTTNEQGEDEFSKRTTTSYDLINKDDVCNQLINLREFLRQRLLSHGIIFDE